MARILKPTGSLWLNVGSSNVSPWISEDIAREFRKQFTLQNHFIWVKSIVIDGVQRGHYKPINSERFANHNWESLYHFTIDGNVGCDRHAVGVPYTCKSNIERFDAKVDVHCGGNVWFIPYKTIVSKSQKGKHPAVFPEELVERCIRFSGIKTGVVLDPFMGTGTTGVVAKRLDLDFIGFDISKEYCDFAKKRISQVNPLKDFITNS